jgi:hypothetical protein
LDRNQHGGVMDKTLQVDGNQVFDLQLTGADVQIIVLALKELPYKHAQPTIDRIFTQMQPKPEPPSGGQ